MPPTLPLRLSPLAALNLGEKDAWLYETRRHDGLRPTQIVRRWGGPGHGLPETAMAALSARLDLSADADRAPAVALPALGGPDAYAANPQVEGVPHPGLWRGGPIQVQFDRNSIPKERGLFLEQTLTLVHHAGTWSVGEGGRVVLGACSPNAVPHVRPSVRDTRAPDAPLADEWTGESGEIEATIRDWTEESREALLQATLPQLGLPSGWTVSERRFETDPETGTGVLVLRGVRRTVWDVASAADLAAADHRMEPARRETIRNWGLGAPQGGEPPAQGRGYAWTVSAEWADISRASWPALLDPARVDCEALGRLLLGASPEWRVLTREILPRDDGLLGFRVTWQRPDLDAAARAPVAVRERNGEGWGALRTSIVPTVPLAEAAARAASAPAPDGTVAVDREVTERPDDAYADIAVQGEAGWDYATAAGTPPGVPSVDGIDAPTVEWLHGPWPGAGGYRAVWRNVRADAVQGVLARARLAVTPSGSGALLTSLRVDEKENGLSDVSAESGAHGWHAYGAQYVSSDEFTETWRQRFDGLVQDASGAWVQAGGSAPAVLWDALGNPVRIPPGAADPEGRRADFSPGRIVTVRMDLSGPVWAAVVETELAIRAEWTYSWITQRSGHTVPETVHVWRNWPSRQSRDAAHGRSVDHRDEINRFGLHDGQWAEAADIHEETRRTVSDSATERTVREDASHTSGHSPEVAAARGQAVSKTVTTYADGLQDVSATTETAKPAGLDMEWAEKRSGHTVRVRQQVRQNAPAMPPVAGAGGERASASASVNRFGLVDATVRRETDVYVVRRVEESETAFQRTRRETANADGSGDAHASQSPGRTESGADEAYSDGLHDTARTVVEAKPQAWSWTWSHVYGRGERATAYGYAFRNQPEGYWQGIPRPADGDGYVYEGSPSVRMNEFGLFDGELAFVPRHDGGGRAADRRMFYATTDVHAEYHERRSYRAGGQTVHEKRKVSRWTTKSYSTSHAGAENAAGAGHAPSHAGHEVVHADVSDPFQSLLGKTMWRTVRVMEKAEQWVAE